VSSATTVRAPAKLTLSLRVTGVRPDGYHLIDAEMISLDLVDTLTISPGGTGMTVDGPFAEGVPCDDRNLAIRALAAAGRSAQIHLHKAIPHGGGLGGGSADAAAVLRWAGFDDLERAAALGADIPFCMVGGRAQVTGIGEIVTPLPPRPLTVTLVIPDFGVSTPAVYRRWDELGGPRGEHGNDLEPAACSVEPRLIDVRARIEAACDAPAVLAGSGATWFVVGRHPYLADVLTDATVVVANAAEGDGSALDER
jgi:4-diphosphocytidyl-2-C-methyl-D-erythritol kinase